MPPKGKKKTTQVKGKQPAAAKKEVASADVKFNMQECGEDIQQAMKNDMQAKLTELFGEKDLLDMVEYVFTASVGENESKVQMLDGLQEFFPDPQQKADFVDWLYGPIRQKYGSQAIQQQNVVQVTAGQSKEESIPKTISIPKEVPQGPSQESQPQPSIFDRVKKKDGLVVAPRREQSDALEIQVRGDKANVGGGKRVKRAEDEPKAHEEVKVSAGTVIDLNSHKNNIRVVGSEQQPEGGSVQNIPEDKKKVRCRHWPNCNNSDEACPFVHPKEDCPYFPKCQFGEKCLMIHPDIQCKFGMSCNRPNCSYKHPKGKQNMGMMGMGGSMQKALMMMMTASMLPPGHRGGKPKNKKWEQQKQQDPERGEANEGVVEEKEQHKPTQ